MEALWPVISDVCESLSLWLCVYGCAFMSLNLNRCECVFSLKDSIWGWHLYVYVNLSWLCMFCIFDPSICPFSHCLLPDLCMCVVSVFFGHCVLTVISLSLFGFPNFTPLYPVCQWAWSRHALGEGGCSEGMSGMCGGTGEGANVSQPLRWAERGSALLYPIVHYSWCLDTGALTEKATFLKHKRKSSFVSSGTKNSLVGILFHCSRTICLLK